MSNRLQFLLGSLLSIFLWNTSLSAQELEVTISINFAGENRFSVCDGERLVGVRVENITGVSGAPMTLTNVICALDLTTVAGIQYSGTLNQISGGAVSVNNAGTPSFNLPNLANGDVVEFQIGLEASCPAVMLAGGGANPNFDFNFTFIGGDGTELKNTGNFEVVKPALSIPLVKGSYNPLLNTYDAGSGITDTLEVTVVNAGDGPLTRFTYWVKDQPILTNLKVIVGTIELPVLGTSGDTTFYDVTSAALAFAIPGAGSPPNNGKFQFNEKIIVQEVWRTDDCQVPTNDILRGARYGCAADLTAKCEEVTKNTGVRFGLLRPNVDVKMVPNMVNPWPACYVSTKPTFAAYMTNNGLVKASNVKFNISSWNGEAGRELDTAKIFLRVGLNGTNQKISPVSIVQGNSSTSLGGALCYGRLAIFEASIVLPFDINPKDTVYVFWQQSTVCFSCYQNETNPGSCQLGPYGYHLFGYNYGSTSTYKDPCGLQTYNLPYRYSDYYQAIMWNFGEGPALVFDNQLNTNTYTFTDFTNHFYNPAAAHNSQGMASSRTYPNAEFKIFYMLPKGIDWPGNPNDLNSNDYILKDLQGDIWRPTAISYTDHEAASGDTLILTYTGLPPANFAVQANDLMTLNYRGDCNETGPACNQGGLVNVQQKILFTADKNCTDCEPMRLNCPEPINVVLKCPGCCTIPGLQPVSLNIKRINFGNPDNDNNYRSDNSGSIDLTKIRQDRFIAGDTLRVQYKGIFTTDGTYPQWEHAFSLIQLPADFPATITPLGGNLTIKNGSNLYNATILQQIPDGLQLVTDLSPQKLKDLGNAGIPVGFNAYTNGDSVILEVLMTVSDNTFELYSSGTVSRPLLIEDRSFATTDATWPVAIADRFTCDWLRDRVYYIEQKHFLSSSDGSFTGGCTVGNIGYDWEGFYIGNNSVDYFPFEFRKPTADVNQMRFVVQEGFNPIAIEWQIYGKDFIGNFYPVGSVPLNSGTYYRPLAYGEVGNPNSGSYYGEVPITSPYVSVIGDTIYFNSGQYIKDNWPNKQADEGYRILGRVHWVASCATPKTSINQIIHYPRYNFETDPKVFGYNSLNSGRVAHPPVTGNFDNSNNLKYGYAGGPQLILQTSVMTQEITGESACFEVDVTNIADAISQYTWLSLKSPSGAVIVNSIQEINSTTGAVMGSFTPQLGIVQIGQINASSMGTPTMRRFRLCVSTDNCYTDSLQVATGWQCNGYPSTLEEANCSQPQTLYMVPVGAELGMIIQDPTTDVTGDLCAETQYVVQLSSTILGTIHDIKLQFELPDHQDFQTGSFEYAYPAPVSGLYQDVTTWIPCPTQPANVYGNTWLINVTDQSDPILATTGLPGTLQLGENFMFVRFKTKTGCDYLSGSKATFLSWALDACDNETNLRFSPSKAVNINGVNPTYKTNITLSPQTLNPCKNDQTTIDLTFSIKPGSLPTGNGDSIRVILPPGLSYIPSSYVPVQNAPATGPLIEIINGQSILYWDVLDGLAPGSTVSFTFGILSSDAAQLCRSYDIIVQNFGSQTSTCVAGGMTCPIRVLANEARTGLSFQKPNLAIVNFSAAATSTPPTETVNYTIEVENSGEAVPNGTSTNIQIYSDVDGDNDVSTGDLLIFTATTTDAIPAGGTAIITGSASVTAGSTCKLIALVNPEATCVCELNESFTVSPELAVSFTNSYSVCSDVLISNIGPANAPNTQYFWSAIDGANLTALSTTSGSPVNFRLRNTGTVPIVQKYALRIVRGGVPASQCYSFDTLSVTVFPETASSAEVVVCNGASFNLAGPTNGSNFLWTPITNLVDPTDPQTSVMPLSANAVYTLNYEDLNGCPAIYTANILVTMCAATGLGDTVWIDRNVNGLQDPGELPVAGVVVYLYNANNTSVPISSTTTDAAGHYFFQPLSAGNYVIGFEAPTGMVFTTSNVPGNDKKDSDVNPLTGLTPAVFIPNGVLDSTLDVGFIVRDWGDAPDTYLTDATGTPGPSHIIIPELHIGTLVDPDVQGKPVVAGTPATGDDSNDGDPTIDEDGVGPFPPLNVILAGSSYIVPVSAFNQTGSNANLVAWLDFNRNGVFDPSEGTTVVVPTGGAFAGNLEWTVPPDVKPGTTYVRVRLTTDAITVNNPAGPASDGEIEDHTVNIDFLHDWSDAPDSYQTDNAGPIGANHILTPGMFLGNNVDPEMDGFPATTGNPATGDNLDNTDDETGVASFPKLLVTTTSYAVSITATNLKSSSAKIFGWIDFNRNGTFQSGESAMVTVPANTNNGNFTLNFTANPATTLAGTTYARFRLTSDPSITSSTPGGTAFDGEVEDYDLMVMCPTITNPSADQAICLNTAPTPFTVITNQIGANSIRFVRFSTPQTGTNMYYGGTTLGDASPDGTGLTTFSGMAAQFNAVGDYYVYAIANPIPADSINCPLPSQEITVRVDPLPTVSVPDATVCYDKNTTLMSTASGGTGTLDYLWAPGAATTSSLLTGNITATTNFSVTVTDDNGCTASDGAVVNNYPQPTPSVSNATVCPGGTAMLTTGIFASYLWSTMETTQSIVKPAGSYSVTVTDGNGCTGVASATISEFAPSAPVMPNAIICPGTTTTLNPGTYAFYNWSSGESTPTVTKGTGTYSVTVTDNDGCTGIASATISNYPTPSVTGGELCLNTTITVTGSGTPAAANPFISSNPAIATVDNTGNINGVSVGSVTITYTDNNNCQATSNVVVNPLPTVSVADAIVCYDKSTTLMANASGGTGTLDYVWTPGGSTISSTTTGNITSATNFSVTVTDDKSCTATDQAQVTNFPQPAPSVADITVCPSESGTLTVGTFVSYLWSTNETTQSIVKTAGSYSVTVTDANSCTGVASATIHEFAPPVPVLADITICPGLTTTLNPGVFSSYLWSTSETTASIVKGLGTYTVTVTDSNGCTGTASATIYNFPPASVTGGEVCDGLTMTVIGSGLPAPVNPFVSSNPLVASINNVGFVTAHSPGTVTITYTDINGCQATNTVIVHPIPTMSDVEFCLNATAVITGSGTPGLVNPYVSSDPTMVTVSNTGLLTPILPGLVFVTYTDNHGCTTQADVIVNPLPSVSIFGVSEICSGSNTILTASTGVTYAWSTGESASAITVSAPGSYSVTISNHDGCTDSRSKTITVSSPPVVSITGANQICMGMSSIFTASGGSSYLWNTGEVTAQITVSTPGTYTVTVTNASNCTASADRTLVVTSTPTVSIAGPSDHCAGTDATFTASGADTYLWSTGATTPKITVSIAGNYSVTATYPGGCTAVGSKIIKPSPLAEITGINEGCVGITTVFTASGGISYLWSTTETSSAITVSTPGAYTVTVTNSSSCTAIASRSLTVNPLPVASIAGASTLCNGTNTTYTASGGTSYLWSTGATTPSITITAPGFYSVTVMDANNCPASANKTLTLIDAPPKPIGSCMQSFCVGDNAVLSDLQANAPGVVWFNGLSGGIQYQDMSLPLTNGTHYYAKMVENGCESLSALEVIVTIVTPAPGHTCVGGCANGN